MNGSMLIPPSGIAVVQHWLKNQDIGGTRSGQGNLVIVGACLYKWYALVFYLRVQE